MAVKNIYDNLKIDCLEDLAPVEPTASWTVTDDAQEKIIIQLAQLPDNYWVYGYIVYWAHGGRPSQFNPSAAGGKFRTQRDAKLHAVGFMQAYSDYFTDTTRLALDAAEASLLQLQLFD